MKLHFTSGYYLEANSQIEYTNQTLKQYLRIYCNYQQSDCKDSSCGCSNSNPNLTLYQSRQRELIRVLVNSLYTTYICLTVCPYLLI